MLVWCWVVGKLVNLFDKLVYELLFGYVGIGYICWVIYGVVIEVNVYFYKCGFVVVVYNGIIENFCELCEEVVVLGMILEFQIDIEIVVLLIVWYMVQGFGLVEVVCQMLICLYGVFVLVFLFEGEGDLMIVVCKGSLFVVGSGDGEMFIGLDVVVLVFFIDCIIYFEDGDYVVIICVGVQIFDVDNWFVYCEIQCIDVGVIQIDKGGYWYFMVKEIVQQLVVLGDVFSYYIKGDCIVLFDFIDFLEVDWLMLVGCGMVYYVVCVVCYWFE